MVKISLQIKATLENIDELYTCHPEYNFILKFKCLNCGDVSEKWHTVTESQTFPTKMDKTEAHYLEKCKLCSRDNRLDIIERSNGKLCPIKILNVDQMSKFLGKFTSDDENKFISLVTFDCRGLEPVEFMPGEGWIAKVQESGKIFEDVDLSEKEWVDYDDKMKQSVGIYEFESKFVKAK